MLRWIVLFVLLTGCATVNRSSGYTNVAMRNLGAEVYDFRIDYAERVLPYGPSGDPEFGERATRVYADEMPIPEVVRVRWRASRDATPVEFSVPLRQLVPDGVARSDYKRIEFHFANEELFVYASTTLVPVVPSELIFHEKR